uniref:Uncharacterized protein n=2 Tax=Xiphophorus TaxID=8082 RepID=A0A3B5Q7A8_XIPMA
QVFSNSDEAPINKKLPKELLLSSPLCFLVPLPLSWCMISSCYVGRLAVHINCEKQLRYTRTTSDRESLEPFRVSLRRRADSAGSPPAAPKFMSELLL